MLDKEKIGDFIARQRKEKGMTQKELAEKLFLSDKAVSKWERGLSLPDVSVLIPLADVLDITVTELLKGERLPAEEALAPQQVDALLQTVIRCGEKTRIPPWKKPRHWLILLSLMILIIAELGILLCLSPWLKGQFSIWMNMEQVLGVLALHWCLPLVFGIYAWLIMEEQLPNYYDTHRISLYYRYGLRFNLPGVRLNNSNWPYILKVLRIWCLVYPLFAPVVYVFLSLLGLQYAAIGMILLACCLGGLFIPLVYVGKKYE